MVQSLNYTPIKVKTILCWDLLMSPNDYKICKCLHIWRLFGATLRIQLCQNQCDCGCQTGGKEVKNLHFHLGFVSIKEIYMKYHVFNNYIDTEFTVRGKGDNSPDPMSVGMLEGIGETFILKKNCGNCVMHGNSIQLTCLNLDTV